MSDSIYRQGNILGKKGTILPRSADRGKEHSGTVFDVNVPLAQNIVEIDNNGVQTVHHLDLEAVAAATRAARAGNVVDPVRFGRQVHAPIPPAYHRVEESPAEDLGFGESNIGLPFKEYIDGVAVSSSKVEPLPKVGRNDVFPPAPVSTVPPQAAASTVVPEVEKLSDSPAPDPKRVIEAYEPLIEKPADLDKEPDAATGPARLSSYTVNRRVSSEDEVPPPLLIPQMETAPVKAPVVNEPFQNTRDVEKASKVSYANLQVAPMRKAKIKVRFKSAMGSLAVAYNVVFKEGIKLIMVQHDTEGLFYEPPGDNETAVEIQWHGDTYVCFPALNFKMPDDQTAFNIYLIDVEATTKLRKE